ncbi:hypothetical protein TREES_T100014955 [Tupaia chinensis]|uniref:Uncharacterized protein n=1 Tax=Tupaia chinensis TaxID=246437 RepID=L9KTN5_TUPCH|nr:hypothetical protein TREES_T100014955 [Tupaia chinensis]
MEQGLFCESDRASEGVPHRPRNHRDRTIVNKNEGGRSTTALQGHSPPDTKPLAVLPLLDGFLPRVSHGWLLPGVQILPQMGLHQIELPSTAVTPRHLEQECWLRGSLLCALLSAALPTWLLL